MHPILRLSTLIALVLVLAASSAVANQALDFDGRDYLLAPNSPSLNPTDAITIEAWCMIPDRFYDLGNCPLIEKAYATHTAPYYQYHMGINSNVQQFLFDLAIDGQRTLLRSPSGALPLGRWVHVAGTYDGAMMRLYIDGEEVSAQAASGMLSSFDTDVFIGRYGNFIDGIVGMIDDVRLWNVARSPEQIRGAMCGGLVGYEAGLVGCWRFEEGEGQVASDLSPNGNDARLGATREPDDKDPAWTAAEIPACPETTIDVSIDIRPGSERNRIKCDGPSQGVVPVAVLTTADFDALTVDQATVRFGPGRAPEAHANRHGVTRHVEDVDGDGDLDLLFHFRIAETGVVCGDTKVNLSGRTFDGRMILGSDVIETSGADDDVIATLSSARISPNPFNPQTTISFTVDATRHVRVRVFDMRGRCVAELVDAEYPQGDHAVVWNGRDTAGRMVPSGQYVFRIAVGNEVLSRKGLLLK